MHACLTVSGARLYDFVAHKDPREVAIFGPGFCDWAVKGPIKERISRALAVSLPSMIHIVIGGIMLFTLAAVERFTDATTLLQVTGNLRPPGRRPAMSVSVRCHSRRPHPCCPQCIDDLETLYAHNLLLWDGLKDSAMYNQDWLFCWCLQVRMGGRVYLDHAFQDVTFPVTQCVTVVDAARFHVGTHHTSVRKLRALWRAYRRFTMREEPNASAIAYRDGGNRQRAVQGDAKRLGRWRSGGAHGGVLGSALVMPADPSRPQACKVNKEGNT